MDPSRFDDLARCLGTPRTRRSVRGSIVGAAAAAVGAGRAIAVACPPGQVAGSGRRCLCKANGRPPGPSGCQALCGGVPVDLGSDPNHCGTCAKVCPTPAGGSVECRNGQCAGVCPAGTTLLGNACCPNAKVCGQTCLAAPCDAGSCQVCNPQQGACVTAQDGASCGVINTCCGEECVYLNEDNDNCGVCGHRCPFGHCNRGRCCQQASNGQCSAEVTCCDGGTCQDGHCCENDGDDCDGFDDLCCSGTCHPTTQTCCTRDCTGKACGADDGCGGVCQTGTCDGNGVCQDGECVCVPNCSPVRCGVDDGCGGTCPLGPGYAACCNGFVCASHCCDDGFCADSGPCCGSPSQQCAGGVCCDDGSCAYNFIGICCDSPSQACNGGQCCPDGRCIFFGTC